jgi:hypothetical protein
VTRLSTLLSSARYSPVIADGTHAWRGTMRATLLSEQSAGGPGSDAMSPYSPSLRSGVRSRGSSSSISLVKMRSERL